MQKQEKNGGEYVHFKCNQHYENPDKCPHYNIIAYQTLKDIVTLRINEFFKLFNNKENINHFIELKSNQTADNSFVIKELVKCEDKLSMNFKKLHEDFSYEKINWRHTIDCLIIIRKSKKNFNSSV